MKILILQGHPDDDSLNSSFADAYQKGAEEKNEVRHVEIGNLKFDPILHKGYKVIQELEPDLKKVQEDIKWSDHIVLFYPVWWGFMPAGIKGFFDRAFLPGFAFKYRPGKMFPEKFLKGKTAHMVVTTDTKIWILRMGLGILNWIIVKNAIFGFTGVNKVGLSIFGSVNASSEVKRKKWLKNMEEQGNKLK